MNAFSFPKVVAALTFLAAAIVPSQAAERADAPQERVKIALNEMVQDVKQAETAPDKRAVMERFLDKAGRGAELAERLPFLGEETRAALTGLQEKFQGYHAELNGLQGHAPVADADLDAFAGFMQQDLEQAAGGGIYLSTGAVIIILLILLLIT